MATFKKVALAGGSGMMGSAILEQLIQHGFEVTVLTRQESTAVFPASVKVERVDYGSNDSLVSSLRGQDAVVSAITTQALGTEPLLIEAAVAAGVRRFIPSEFGSDTTNEKAATFPLYAKKLASHKALAAAASANPNFTYTSIITGPLLGWVVGEAFMSPTDKRASLYNGGSRDFSTVTLPTIGKTVCAVLSHPEETKNRVVKVHDAVTTLNKLLAMARKAVGEEGWTITKPSVEEALANSWAGVKQGKFDWPTLFGFIVAASQGEGYGGKLEGTDNDLLGIPEKTDEELQAIVNRIAAGGGGSVW